jgi:hypothetical protein
MGDDEFSEEIFDPFKNLIEYHALLNKPFLKGKKNILNMCMKKDLKFLLCLSFGKCTIFRNN